MIQIEIKKIVFRVSKNSNIMYMSNLFSFKSTHLVVCVGTYIAHVTRYIGYAFVFVSFVIAA